MKYNLSEIMKRAWDIAKTEAKVEFKKAKVFFADALKMAWAEAKAGCVVIKEWFEHKLAEQFGLGNIYSLELVCGIKETEKAVYAMFYTGYNRTGRYATRRCGWVPKSVISNLQNLTFCDYDAAVERFEREYPEM